MMPSFNCPATKEPCQHNGTCSVGREGVQRGICIERERKAQSVRVEELLTRKK